MRIKKPLTVLHDTEGQPWPFFRELIPIAGQPFLSGPTESILTAADPIVNFFQRPPVATTDTKEQAWPVLKS